MDTKAEAPEEARAREAELLLRLKGITRGYLATVDARKRRDEDSGRSGATLPLMHDQVIELLADLATFAQFSGMNFEALCASGRDLASRPVLVTIRPLNSSELRDAVRKNDRRAAGTYSSKTIAPPTRPLSRKTLDRIKSGLEKQEKLLVQRVDDLLRGEPHGFRIRGFDYACVEGDECGLRARHGSPEWVAIRDLAEFHQRVGPYLQELEDQAKATEALGTPGEPIGDVGDSLGPETTERVKAGMDRLGLEKPLRALTSRELADAFSAGEPCDHSEEANERLDFCIRCGDAL